MLRVFVAKQRAFRSRVLAPLDARGRHKLFCELEHAGSPQGGGLGALNRRRVGARDLAGLVQRRAAFDAAVRANVLRARRAVGRARSGSGKAILDCYAVVSGGPTGSLPGAAYHATRRRVVHTLIVTDVESVRAKERARGVRRLAPVVRFGGAVLGWFRAPDLCGLVAHDWARLLHRIARLSPPVVRARVLSVAAHRGAEAVCRNTKAGLLLIYSVAKACLLALKEAH